MLGPSKPFPRCQVAEVNSCETTKSVWRQRDGLWSSECRGRMDCGAMCSPQHIQHLEKCLPLMGTLNFGQVKWRQTIEVSLQRILEDGFWVLHRDADTALTTSSHVCHDCLSENSWVFSPLPLCHFLLVLILEAVWSVAISFSLKLALENEPRQSFSEKGCNFRNMGRQLRIESGILPRSPFLSSRFHHIWWQSKRALDP